MLSTQRSFYNWLNRDNAKWSNPDLSIPLQSDNKINQGCSTMSSKSNIFSEPFSESFSNSTACKNKSNPSSNRDYSKSGFTNIGNSSWSAILQVLSVTKVMVPGFFGVRRVFAIRKDSYEIYGSQNKIFNFPLGFETGDVHEILTSVLNSLLSPTLIPKT